MGRGGAGGPRGVLEKLVELQRDVRLHRCDAELFACFFDGQVQQAVPVGGGEELGAVAAAVAFPGDDCAFEAAGGEAGEDVQGDEDRPAFVAGLPEREREDAGFASDVDAVAG